MEGREIKSEPTTPGVAAEVQDRPKSANGLLQSALPRQDLESHAVVDLDAQLSSDEDVLLVAREYTFGVDHTLFEEQEGSSRTMNGSEKDLRYRIEEQEKLICGYQKENEIAASRIKALESDVQRLSDLLDREKQRCKRQLLQARQEAEARDRENVSKLQKMLQLQEELQQNKETSAVQANELKLRIEELCREKKILEAKMAGLNLTEMETADCLVQEVTKEKETMQQSYEKQVKELQEKLQWYTENQELITKKEKCIEEQALLIAQLKKKSAHKQGGMKSHLLQKNAKLEREVKSLKDALASRNPDSVAALIHLSKATDGEQDHLNELQNKVHELQLELKHRDEKYEMELRTLRQQYERVKLESLGNRSKQKASDSTGASAFSKKHFLKGIQKLNRPSRKEEESKQDHVARKQRRNESRYSSLPALQQQIHKNKKLETLLADKTDEVADLKRQAQALSASIENSQKNRSFASQACQTSPERTSADHDLAVLDDNTNGHAISERHEGVHAAAVDCHHAVSNLEDLSFDHDSGTYSKPNETVVNAKQVEHWIHRCGLLEGELALFKKGMQAKEHIPIDSNRGTTTVSSSEDISFLSQRIETLQECLISQGIEYQARLKNIERAYKLQLASMKNKMQRCLMSRQFELNEYKAQMATVLETVVMLKQNIFS